MARAEYGVMREWPADFDERGNYCLTQLVRQLENPRSALVPS
jgi:hypothetical protein